MNKEHPNDPGSRIDRRLEAAHERIKELEREVETERCLSFRNQVTEVEKERDQLREQVKMLRNELNMIYKLVPDLVVFQMEPSALAATEPK